QVKPIDRLDHREPAFDELHLVGLQVADQMPAGVAGTNGLDLGHRFLHAIFTERLEPEAYRVADRRDGNGLGDGDQRDRGWVPTCSPRTSRRRSPNRLQACGDRVTREPWRA